MIGVIVCNKFAEFLILFCIEFKRKMQCFLYQVQDYTNDFPKDVIAVILALHNETCTCECHLYRCVIAPAMRCISYKVFHT